MAILSSFPVQAILSLRSSDDPRWFHRNGYELDAFLRHVAEAFTELDGAGAGDLLSLRWIGNLLDVLLSCFEGFRAVLVRADAGALVAAPMARVLADFIERGVKALDVCNAVRDGVAEIRQRRRHLGIVAASIGCSGALSKGRLRRARKALAVDTIRDEIGSSVAPRRRWSFGKEEYRRRRRAESGEGGDHRSSHTWSAPLYRPAAARQRMQGISFPAAPRGHEMVATEGLAEAVYAMGQVLAVVMEALAAALPSSSSSSPQLAAAMPRGFAWWSSPIVWIHERILNEARKRKEEEHNQQCSSAALLKEERLMERRSQRLMDLINAARFPYSGEEGDGIRLAAEELREANEAVEEKGLERVDKRIRAVFQCILRLRREGLDGSPKFSIPLS